MTDFEDLTQDDIYDDGLSITNKIAFNGLKTVFESTPETGPKPKVPTKPGLSPRNNVNTAKSSAMNGGVNIPVLPAKSSFMRSDNETKPAGHLPKRNSKVNIPDIFSNANSNDPPKPSPKPAVKPPVTPLKPKPNTVPWSQRNKDSDEKAITEHSKDENVNKVTPKLQDKPPWTGRQRQASDNEKPVQPPLNNKLIWSQKQALQKEGNTTESGNKPLNSPNQLPPKSPNVEKTDESALQPKRKCSVLEKYNITEQIIKPVATSPKPVVSPRINKQETLDEKNESQSSVNSSPKRQNHTPFGGIANIETLKLNLKHVTPGNIRKTDGNVNLRNKSSVASDEKRKSIIRKSLTRKVDGLKFYVVDFDDVKSASISAPFKPPKLKEKFDLDQIIANYQASLVDIDPSSSKNEVTELDEELYEPIPADEDVPMRESGARVSSRVSRIPSMSEADEFNNQEEYDDCDVMKPPVPRGRLPDLPSSIPPARPPKSKPQPGNKLAKALTSFKPTPPSFVWPTLLNKPPKTNQKLKQLECEIAIDPEISQTDLKSQNITKAAEKSEAVELNSEMGNTTSVQAESVNVLLSIPPPIPDRPHNLMTPKQCRQAAGLEKVDGEPVIISLKLSTGDTLRVPEDDIGEEYDDCAIAQTAQELDQDEVYEPLDDLDEIKEEKTVAEETKKDAALVEEKKDDKLSEKERKKREKEEQKRLKDEKKKQEKELKELKTKFKVEPFQLENTQGEGNVRKDAKGGKLDLHVKAGQRVILVRLVNNPAGKWLVKLKEEGKVGYVDANNVEVDNNIIRNVMEGSYVNMHQLSNGANTSADNDIEQEEYADAVVEQEEYADVVGTEPIEEDLYEPC